MAILNANLRDLKSKGKRLRREGLIPGILFGKHLENSIPIQLSLKDSNAFLKENSVGSTVDLFIDGEEHMALLKDISRTPGSAKLEHLSFQAMVAGEKVNSVVRIEIVNEDKVDGIVLQSVYELAYRALPKDLVERIEIDVALLNIGESLNVGDLEIAKNEAIEILVAPEISVLSVAARKVIEVETDEADEETESMDEETESEEETTE